MAKLYVYQINSLINRKSITLIKKIKNDMS